MTPSGRPCVSGGDSEGETGGQQGSRAVRLPPTLGMNWSAAPCVGQEGPGRCRQPPDPGRGRPWHAGRGLRLGTKAGSVSFEVLLPAWQPRRPQQFTATYARLFLASAPQMTGVCSEGPRTGCSSPRPQPLEKARGGMPSPAPTPQPPPAASLGVTPSWGLAPERHQSSHPRALGSSGSQSDPSTKNTPYGNVLGS